VAPERQQLLLLLVSAALLVPLGMIGEVTRAIGLVLVPVAVAVGVLRYRLLGIEQVLRRTLLYGVLTGLVVSGVRGHDDRARRRGDHRASA
jgi:hypothetical protein